jgi:DNA-binding transcriptional regulator YiaG
VLRFDDAGLRNVWLANGYEVHDTPYGKATSYHDIHGLTRAICTALVDKPGPLTGAEFRYLRLHLRLSQASLGKLLDVSEQSVALWEKRGRIPRLADKHLRLLWKEKHAGNEPIVRAMARLNVIERLLSQKIVVRESRRGWVAQTEEEAVA